MVYPNASDYKLITTFNLKDKKKSFAKLRIFVMMINIFTVSLSCGRINECGDIVCGDFSISQVLPSQQLPL